MKQYKTTLLLGSLITVLPIPVQLLLGRDWSLILLLPLFLLAVHWFCVYWTFQDPRQKNQGRKPTLMILWIIPILSLCICAVDYCFTEGISLSLNPIGCLFFGLLFLVTGNYLPKVKQNSTLGIKIYWAYTSEENWNATHRFAGKLWVIGGTVIALGGFLPGNWAVGCMMTVTVLMCVLPVLYSWRYCRMQKARGDTLIPAPRFPGKLGKLSLVFLVLVLVFVAVMMFTGDIEYRFEDTCVIIEADYYHDLVLAYDDIASIELREANVDGTRAWGYGSARLLMGTFQNEEFGNYTRYTYTNAQSAVVLSINGRAVVISGKTPQETKEIFDTLAEKVK